MHSFIFIKSKKGKVHKRVKSQANISGLIIKLRGELLQECK